MIIVTASDQRYAPLVATMLHSAGLNNPDARFYMFDCGLEPETRAVLQAFAGSLGIRLTIVDVDLERFVDLPTSDLWPAAVYTRFLIPEILPDDCDRAIYLDADCIVTGDLSELWTTQLGDNLFAGVEDPSARTAEASITGLEIADYVNSGVMLINIRLWRQEKILGDLVEFARNKRPFFQDQSSLNAVCAGRIMSLYEHWNFMMHLPRSADCRIWPQIIHYAGKIKSPQFADDIFAPVWVYHRSAVPFPTQPLPKRPLFGTINRLLRLDRPQWTQAVLQWRFNRRFLSAYRARLALRA